MISKAAMLAVLLLAGCAPSDGPERVVERRLSADPAPRGEALLREAMLTKHNAARAAVGVPGLTWDARLAADALVYAHELARTRRFEHANQPQGPGREGENLFTGTRGAYSYTEMVQLWIDEKTWFLNRTAPNFSSTGNGEAVAHYTQIIWRTTTRVGCALASNDQDDYLVCRYSPSGNVIGLTAL